MMISIQDLLHLCLAAGVCCAGFQPSFHWDPRNPIFQQPVEIKVHLNSKRNFICPNPASVLTEQDSSIPEEQMYENMWIVDKQEYDTCSVNTSALSDPLVNRKLMICRNPLQLSYYEMVFRSNSPPGGLEFTPGITCYFIATSNGTSASLSNLEGGRCVSSNMKLAMYVCSGPSDPYCTGTQTIQPSPSVCSVLPTTDTSDSTSSIRSRSSTTTTSISSSSTSNSGSTITRSSSSSSSSGISSGNTFTTSSSSSSSSSSTSSSSSSSTSSSSSSSSSSSTSSTSSSSTSSTSSSSTRSSSSSSTSISSSRNSISSSSISSSNSLSPTSTMLPLPCSASIPDTYINVKSGIPVLKNCKELLDANYMESGSYRVDPTTDLAQENDEMGPFRAYCDQETAGGGWTVIMRRFDGFVNFFRKYLTYVEGFGSISGEFWIGLKKLWQLCGQFPVNLRFDFEAEDGVLTYAEYSGCSIGDWTTKYKLIVGQFIGGGAGDALSALNDVKFAAHDKPNNIDCFSQLRGAWWVSSCDQGAFPTGRDADGNYTIRWGTWNGANLTKVEIKVKPT